MEITEEVLQSIQNITPGDYGVFLARDGALLPLYLSDELHTLAGMDRASFEELTAENAAAIVMPADLGTMHNALRDCVAQNRQTDCLFRIRHRTRGFEWVRARFHVCGEQAGEPVLFSLFTTVAPEKNIYQNILDRTHTMVYICDRESYEILYLNQAAKNYARNRGESFVGRTCYQFIRGGCERCRDCYLDRIKPGEILNTQCYNETRGFWEKITGEYISWGGREAFVMYLDDVSETMEKQLDLQRILESERRIVEDVQILNGTRPLAERIDLLLTRISAYFGADRAYIFEVDPEGTAVSNTFERCRNGAAPQIDSLQHVDIGCIDGWKADFDRNRAVIIPEVAAIKAERPLEYEILTKQDIRSIVVAPLLDGGRLTGFFGVDNPTAEGLEKTGDMMMTLAFAVSAALLREANELQLKKSQERYQLAVEGAGLGVWEYDIRRHRITSPSHSFKRFGVPDVVEDVPASILPMTMPEDRDKLLNIYRRIEAGEEHIEEYFWMKWREDMPARCEHVVYSVQRDENGEPAVAYGLGMDATAQMQEKERYELARRQLEEAHPAALGSFHLNLTKNWCGDGKSPLDFVLKQQESGTADGYLLAFSDLIADEDVKTAYLAKFDRKSLLERFKNGETYLSLQYPIVYENGARHWRNAQLYMLQNPITGDVEAVTYAVDIDEQKKNELIARRITGENFEYIGLVDPRLRSFELRYGRAERIFGSPEASRCYDDAAEETKTHVDPAERGRFAAEAALDAVVAGLRRDGSYHFSYRRRDGDDTSLRNIQFYWLEKPEGLILMVAADITAAYEQEQLQAETLHKALLEAEHANVMKTEFLSNVSHDMRTPLNAVLGYADLALKTGTAAEKDAYLEKVQKAGGILLSLINDTLDLSKIETGAVTLKPAPISCGEIIKRIVASVRPEMDKKHIRFVLENSRAVMATINVDALRLQEIFINLLSNALKFTPEGGEITLTVECLKLEPDCVHDRLSVRDNGCGMSAEFLPKVFEPFAQERLAANAGVGGSGLGLSIVKRLVELMGGTIEVRSELGAGTEFVVCLDFERVDDVLVETNDERVPMDALRGRRVLLCEDNAMNTEIAKALLEMRGVTVDCAENGQLGCERFEASAPGTYDAVLMDIRMPVLDGYHAARRLRALPRPDAGRVPIIAMTADAYDDDVRRCTESGMNDHISKPIDPELLYRTLQSFVEPRERP